MPLTEQLNFINSNEQSLTEIYTYTFNINRHGHTVHEFRHETNSKKLFAKVVKNVSVLRRVRNISINLTT